MKYEQQDWVRVTRAHPCQVCGRDHFCTVSPDGLAALCTKIKSGKERETMNGPAWIHVLDGSEPARPKPQKNGIDWGSRQAAFRSTLTDELRDELAAILGVDSMALDEIGVGWDAEKETWTFPMHDAEGGICGMTWRNREGEKKHYGGSSVGLYRRVGAPDDGPVAIVEGASDTAAVLSYGEVDVIGLPSACTAVSYLVPYVRDREVIVIGDNDDGAGARSVAAVLEAVRPVARSVSKVFPPEGIKDARTWRGGGASWSDIVGKAELMPSPAKTVETPVDVIDRWMREGPLVHEPTGFPTLDKMTRGGFVHGTVTVFNGAPDASKTMLLTVLCDRYIERGLVVGYLAVDEDSDGIVTRFIQRRGWKRDEVESRDREKLIRMRAAVLDVSQRIAIYDSTWTIDKAALDLKKRADKLGVRSVFAADSLQTIRCELEAEIRSVREQVTARMMALKSAASQLGHMVLVSGEMVRAGYDDRGNPVSDMVLGKESGSIEYQGKVVISVKAVRNEDSKVALHIAKNKVGFRHSDPKAAIYLELNKDGQSMSEVDAPEGANDEESKRLAKAQKRLSEAALAAVALAQNQGLSTRDIRAAIREAAGSVSNDTVDDILYLLRIQRVQGGGQGKGSGTRIRHFLDGSQVPQEVLNLIAPERRGSVLAARPVTPDK